jgi:hypothetical protein
MVVAPNESSVCNILRGGEEVSRLAHYQNVVGSSPTPATK